MKVLIVDDNEAVTIAMRSLMEGEDCRVRTAMDGKDGYSAYLHFRPDIVITDIEMPRKNGFEMMKDIRIHDPEIRAIYMSADLDRFCPILEQEKKRYRSGILGKPFSIIELVSILSERRGRDGAFRNELD